MHALIQEQRPLKRARLGPPDVYPQDAKQKEDELTPSNVKHGFSTMPPLSDEFGTAHNSNVTSVKVAAFLNSVISKKEELMTLQDTGRKKQQINCKDNFWPVSPRTKSALDAWFKDLAGNKPLISLAKKAPSFNKKEDIFITLCDNQVNMQRATWFIKLSAAYTLSFTESKNKKRSIYDPAADWTSNITKLMREILYKLQEHGNAAEKSASNNLNAILPTPHSNSNSNASSLSPASANVPQQQSASSASTPFGAGGSVVGGSAALGTGGTGIASNFDDSKNALKYWKYCTQLSRYMYEEALLDRQEFLNWLLDLVDKIRSPVLFDGFTKKLILAFALQYMQDIVQSERICRKLVYTVAEKLTSLLNISKFQNGKYAIASAPASSSQFDCTNTNQIDLDDECIKQAYMQQMREYTACPHHHDIITYLSTILQIITIECPTALVWCGIGGGDSRSSSSSSSSALSGSPLDNLVMPPSALPMPRGCEQTNFEIRKQLIAAENEIIKRSKHAENRWFSEKWLDTNNQQAYAQHILSILDQLDNYCFERIDQSNSIHALYANIFSAFPAAAAAAGAGGAKYEPKQDAETVKILCEWAVSNQRWGEHRAFVVAILLDKRQLDVTLPQEQAAATNSGGNNNAQQNEDADSLSSCGLGLIDGLPVFQTILMDFLDNDAPVIDESDPAQAQSAQSQAQNKQFTNLVHLFSTLIRYDVFSYNAYLHTLISRGDLVTENQQQINGSSSTSSTAATTTAGLAVVSSAAAAAAAVSKNQSTPVHHTFEEDFSANIDFKQSDFDDSNVDDDLDKLLQNIKEKGQQNTLEAPDSPKIPDHHTTSAASCNNSSTNSSNPNQQLVSRHFLYTKHFPIPQEQDSSGACWYSSESNQRYILLYGIGKERDEKKHTVKKLAKDISKLFSKKFSIDIAESSGSSGGGGSGSGSSGKIKKHSRNEFNFESTMQKCQQLPYFEQHVITSQCAAIVLEQLNGFAMGSINYLPVQEHVAFLFDLMEMALNISCLLDLCDSILKELPEIEYQLQAKKSNLTRNYTTSLALFIVGILRRYNSCLLLSYEQTLAMFEGLCKSIKHVVNPCVCSSAERCILAYLCDLYDACMLIVGNTIGGENVLQCSVHQLQLIKRFKALLVVPTDQQPNLNAISAATCTWKPDFLQQLFNAPRRGGKVDTSWIRQVQESSSNMYSFVSNAFIAICRENDNERLNDLAISCAEVTASCNSLSEEWLAALQSICNASKEERYPHLFGQIDIHSSKVHNSLAILICILVARHCFSLADFIVNFALPTLANAYAVEGEITAVAEAGARLTCHLVLKLFKSIEIPQNGGGQNFFNGGSSTATTPTHTLNVVQNGGGGGVGGHLNNSLNANAAAASNFNIKLSCDRHLLVGAHKNIPIEAVLAVLKAILIVVDKKKQPSASTSSSSSSTSLSAANANLEFAANIHAGSTPKHNERPLADLSQILGTSDLSSLTNDQQQQSTVGNNNNNHNECSNQAGGGNNGGNEQISLLDFAYHVLKEICAQEHVLERCLKHADKLCDMIIDAMLTTKQVQRLLHMICYTESEYTILAEMDQRAMIARIMENLKKWTLRISWLDLQLMYRQAASNQIELNSWLDTVARAALNVFQMEPSNPSNKNGGNNSKSSSYKAKASTWLVTPLILKLTPAVQARILRIAGQVLENMTYFSKISKMDSQCGNSGGGGGGGNSSNNCGGNSNACDDREKALNANNAANSSNLNSTTMTYNGKQQRLPLNYNPFLGLILACLRDQDDHHKEELLFSLYTQLTQFLQTYSELESLYASSSSSSSSSGDLRVGRRSEDILDSLQVRFSLIGGLFGLIKKSGTTTTDWAILLVQLICQGVIDHNSNTELFTTVIDMLATLVHFTLTSVSSHADRDENKRLYINLMKKLKKEIGERNNTSIKVIRQLLPLYKQATEVISCEPAGVDTKEKKQLRISVKQRISVWDILEGYKNPAPLSWVWFGAVKLERKHLAYEESHKVLKYHTHSINKPSSYFFEPLPLPPEDVEQNLEKTLITDEMKADTPSSVDQSPSASSVSGRSRTKGTTTRKRKVKTPKTPPVNANLPPQLGPQQQQSSNPQQLQAQAQNATAQQQQLNQNQHPNQQQQQQQPQMNQAQAQMNAMQMNMQMGNAAQFGANPMMQPNPNQMMQQQLQQGGPPGNMQAAMGGNMQQNPQMAYMAGGGAGGAPGMLPSHPNAPNTQQQQHPQQPQWVGQNQYQTLPQQQQQQAFYQQSVQMNRFERPQMNNSKQALSNMLRQRQPAFNHNKSTFDGMQAQRQPNSMQQPQQQVPLNSSVHQQQHQQHQLQQQQQQYARGGGAGMRVVNPAQMGPQSVGVGVGGGLNPAIAMNQNQMMQSQQGGVNAQQNAQGMGMNPVVQNANSNNPMLNSQVGGNLVNTAAGMMQGNVGVNVGGVGVGAGVGVGNSNVVNPNLNQSVQFQNFNQFQQQQQQQQVQQQQLNPNANPKQAAMGFNQVNSQRNPNDFIAQQQQQQQQQRAAAAGMMNNRGQFMNSAPNVTMNNLISQNNLQSYGRQPPSAVGKPGGIITPQQQFQQQRFHQMMQMQGNQMNQMNQQNAGNAVIGQQQNPGVNQQQQQQNPNLVAQLQIQMPGQSNLIGQQYSHQGPPY